MMFTEWPFLDRFDAAAEAGFPAVEYLFPYDHPPEAIAARLERNGLTQALFNLPPGDWAAGERGMAALPDRFADCKAGVDTALAYAEATGCRRLHLMAGLADRTDAEARAAIAGPSPHAAERLAEKGIDLLLEPINGRDMPGYFLDDFADAAALIAELALPNLKLQFDIYHRQILHGDVTMAAAPSAADHRPCPGRERADPPRAGRRGAELPLPVRGAGSAGLRRLRRLRVPPPRRHRRGAGLVDALPNRGGVTVMTLGLGCIADDYTGASDLANTLTRAGLRTVQTIGVPEDPLELPEVDAVVVSLKSRSIPAGAGRRAGRARPHGWLKARGAGRVLFKVCSTFNSTDARQYRPGHRRAPRRTAGGGIVMVTPAFPETGRTVYMGHLFVGAVPLHESPLKDHPLNPMRDANLVRVLGKPVAGPGRPGATGRRSSGARRPSGRVLPSSPGPGWGRDHRCGARTRDLATDRHAVAAGRPVSTGASGLGLGIARALVASRRGPGRSGWGGRDAPGRRRGGDRGGKLLAGDAGAARGRRGEHAGGAARSRASPGRRRRGGTRACVCARAARPTARSPSRRAPRPSLSRACRRGTGASWSATASSGPWREIAARLVEAGVRRLVVAGGETSGAAVDRLGIPAFLLGPEIAPGVPVLRTAGGTGDDMLVALKSGNFGGPDFFAKALGLMRSKTGAPPESGKAWFSARAGNVMRTMLCLADRQFFGHALWQEATGTGADLLWRVKRNVR